MAKHKGPMSEIQNDPIYTIITESIMNYKEKESLVSSRIFEQETILTTNTESSSPSPRSTIVSHFFQSAKQLELQDQVAKSLVMYCKSLCEPISKKNVNKILSGIMRMSAQCSTQTEATANAILHCANDFTCSSLIKAFISMKMKQYKAAIHCFKEVTHHCFSTIHQLSLSY